MAPNQRMSKCPRSWHDKVGRVYKQISYVHVECIDQEEDIEHQPRHDGQTRDEAAVFPGAGLSRIESKQSRILKSIVGGIVDREREYDGAMIYSCVLLSCTVSSSQNLLLPRPLP